MQRWSAALVILHGRLVALASPHAAPGYSTDPGCLELCKEAKGLGSSDCITECRTFTDEASDSKSALGEFVTDKSYNEARGNGGEAMEDKYQEMFGSRIPDCVPTVKGPLNFGDFDANGDGKITEDEAEGLALKMCVSDEMVLDMFYMADADYDDVVTQAEYDAIGEETAAENVVDNVADSQSHGDNEYNEVKLPPFEEFDKDADGTLNGYEIESVMMWEFHNRFPGKADAQFEDMSEDTLDLLAMAMANLDTNDDGLISKEEWYAKGPKEDMGTEMEEAAKFEGAKVASPDSLPAVEHPTISPPPPDYLPPAAPATPAPSAAIQFHARSLVLDMANPDALAPDRTAPVARKARPRRLRIRGAPGGLVLDMANPYAHHGPRRAWAAETHWQQARKGGSTWWRRHHA